MSSINIRSYLTGIGWFILSLFTSSANDILSKYVGLRVHSFEIGFFRFLFGTITLVPFIIYYGKNTLNTYNFSAHLLRGVLLFVSMTSWIFGLNTVSVTTATVLSFAVPLFVLILAPFFLNENIIWQRYVVTIVGFIGIVVTLSPQASDFNPASLIFILSSLGFAVLDIINKKILIKESIISMLLYSSLITTFLAIPPTIYFWENPTFYELTLCFIVGCNTNVTFYFILKAFSMIEVTATAPYRYLELIISTIFSYLILNEIPQNTTLYGALIIIPCTLFIIYSEKNYGSKKSFMSDLDGPFFDEI